MQNDDDLLLDAFGGLDSPLDQLQPVASEDDIVQPHPDEMLELLGSSDPQQSMLAARFFCDVQDSRAIAPLICLLSNSCPLVRVSAAYGLGRNPSNEAVDALIHQLASDWNGYVRKGVVWALGNCQDLRTQKPLIGSLKEDIPSVRLWAASALGQMASLGYDAIISAIPPLIEAMLNDPVAAVRSNAAWSIGQLCRELPSNVVYATAVDALIEAFAEDDDLGVREDARAAVLKLGDTRGLQVIEAIEIEGII
ncbi:MAG: HEAT repeat domain-containing protein [Merismopedia sp. SIO2A8]|nr:HEAT repeat domain-containing protein [Symploca sp. SIO2B6]NET51183.1 HEAT repeat domain-containing protein [Merismopedia sp. SIO2A8]